MALITEFGMGASLRRGDGTAAAERALRNALWNTSIDAAGLFGLPKGAMRLTAEIGVPDPSEVDVAALTAVFPYGLVSLQLKEGGLSVPRPGGNGTTVVALAAITVRVDPDHRA